MKTNIQKRLERVQLMTFKTTVTHTLPHWCIYLPIRILKHLNIHCQSYHLDPKILNEFSEEDFKNIYGLGEKAVKTILDCRGKKEGDQNHVIEAIPTSAGSTE